MTIKTSLISLKDAVQQGQTLFDSLKVILPTGDEAEIYGFIASEDNPLSNAVSMAPLGESLVLSNRVIFTFDKVLYNFPIFTSVCRTNKDKYNLHLLFIPKFFTDLTEPQRSYYIESMKKEEPHYHVSRIPKVSTHDKVAYYEPNNNDLYFKSRSKLKGIGTEFEVITRRVSKHTDTIKYEIFDSYSVMIDQKTIPSAPAENPFQIL